jgi:transposase
MRAVLAGEVATPKRQDGTVEMIRTLRVARRSAMLARIQAGNQLHGLLARAPEKLRTQLRGLPTAKLATTVAAFRPGPDPPTTLVGAAKVAMRELGRRYLALQAELGRLEEVVQPLVAEVAPGSLALPGVGPETAAALLEAAGDNPERLTSEAAFALLCGVAPLPASSGKVTRHRVNPGGNRQANEALWRIVLVRMKCHLPTRAYVERRTKEGLSKPEIMRCLKRYVAREVYRHLRPRALSPKRSGRL